MEKFETRRVTLKTGETLVVREAAPADAAALVAYLNRVGGQSDNLTFGKDDFGMTAEQEEIFLQTFREEKTSAVFLGCIGEEIAANCTVSGYSRRARTAHRASFAIGVEQSFWGKGIARKMMEAAMDFCRQAGIEQLELEVRTDNTPAIRLYQSMGFQTIGIHPNFLKIGDTYCDLYIMYVKL